MPECTALMKRPCTALVRTNKRSRQLRRVYRCQDCGLYACVCAEPNVLSIGKPLAEARDRRSRERWVAAIDEVIDYYANLMRLRVVPPEDA